GILGSKMMRGGIGGWIDVLGMIGRVRGVGGRLGFGGLEMNEGLDLLLDIGWNFVREVIIIVIARVLFTW
ncbi:BCCT family transporter, partial [Staphylococcus saprophyticus]|uniref:BCCT family transporter n=1 Tax=Staphylococcus saprophyticus TaxID=29385 RepID=UPI001642D863